MAFPSIDMFIVALLDLVASGAFLTFVCMEFPKFMILESVVVFILSLLCFIGIFIDRIAVYLMLMTANITKLFAVFVLLAFISMHDMIVYRLHMVAIMIIHCSWLLLALVYAIVAFKNYRKKRQREKETQVEAIIATEP